MRILVRPSTLFLAAALAAAPSPRAEVSRGDRVTAKDAVRVADLVSPGVLHLVRGGMTLDIASYRPTTDPSAYRQATEKYSAQVRLRPDGTIDESTYVAGQPFPIIDPNDPEAAAKIAYNVERSRYYTDDFSAPLSGGTSGRIEVRGERRTLRAESHLVIENYRALRYVGRTERPPIPALPNPLGLFEKLGQYPFLEPYDLKGMGGLGYRYLDSTREDDTWLYLPSFRRVRRVPVVQRSEAVIGQDIDVDSLRGFSAPVAWFGWKLLGARPMLGSLQGERIPPRPCPEDSGVAFCESWEPRPRVYVIEGRPRLASYGYSRRLLFVDAESSAVLYTDLYDQRGELWRVAVNFFRHATRANPGVAVENAFARDFLAGFLMVDLRAGHATRFTFPDVRFPEEAGWHVNSGLAESRDEDWFTVAAMVAAGR